MMKNLRKTQGVKKTGSISRECLAVEIVHLLNCTLLKMTLQRYGISVELQAICEISLISWSSPQNRMGLQRLYRKQKIGYSAEM